MKIMASKYRAVCTSKSLNPATTKKKTRNKVSFLFSIKPSSIRKKKKNYVIVQTTFYQIEANHCN